MLYATEISRALEIGKILPTMYVEKYHNLVKVDEVITKIMKGSLIYKAVILTDEHLRLFGFVESVKDDGSVYFINPIDTKIQLTYNEKEQIWVIVLIHESGKSSSIKLCEYLHEFQLIMNALTNQHYTFNLNTYNKKIEKNG